MSEEDNYNEELELLFGKKPNLRIAYKDSGMYPSQIILDRNRFLRRLTKVMIVGVGLSLVTVTVLSVGLKSAANKPPLSLAFLYSPDNQVVELQSTSIPHVTEAEVLLFATRKLKQFHKVSFTDYIEYITSLEKEFTNQNAFENYQLGMLNSKVIEQITTRRLSSWAEPTTAPQIIDYNPDKQIWHIQLSFNWYMGGGTISTNGREYQIDLIIKTVSRERNITGLAVDSYFIKPL